MSTIRVKTMEGQLMPLESHPRQRFTGERDVPDTEFYRRRIMKGELTLVGEPAEAPAELPAESPAETTEKQEG